MLPYLKPPLEIIRHRDGVINSFVTPHDTNVDEGTIASFGKEWMTFHQFSDEELKALGNDYFDILPQQCGEYIALDLGCGSGRWAYYLADKLKFIEAIDPSDAVISAAQMLKSKNNVRVTKAGVGSIPFADSSFDLVYSLGVLHHLPDPPDAIAQCFRKVKAGGYFLVYLYYNLDNRGPAYRALFMIIDRVRRIISRLEFVNKSRLTFLIAALIYFPLAKLASVVSIVSPRTAERLPLSYYRKTSFYVMRNDALDRFGTPLEKRFSRSEIEVMLKKAGFTNIQFSKKEPYWHAIAYKP